MMAAGSLPAPPVKEAGALRGAQLTNHRGRSMLEWTDCSGLNLEVRTDIEKRFGKGVLSAEKGNRGRRRQGRWAFSIVQVSCHYRKAK